MTSMINLLPQNLKRRITLEYRWRLVTTASALAGTAAIVASTFLIPSYLLVLTREHAANDDAASAASALGAGDNKTNASRIAALKNMLSVLDTRTATPILSRLIDELTSSRIAGITITNIRLIAGKGSSYAVTVMGQAQSRSELLVFNEALKQHANFSGINLPIDELIKNTDIPYHITFTYTQ